MFQPQYADGPEARELLARTLGDIGDTVGPPISDRLHPAELENMRQVWPDGIDPVPGCYPAYKRPATRDASRRLVVFHPTEGVFQTHFDAGGGPISTTLVKPIDEPIPRLDLEAEGAAEWNVFPYEVGGIEDGMRLDVLAGGHFVFRDPGEPRPQNAVRTFRLRVCGGIVLAKHLRG